MSDRFYKDNYRFEIKTTSPVQIDFLYLDLSVCQRCQKTENNLMAAIDEVSEVLKASGIEVRVNKININSRALAIKHAFVSSPTIRINGKDIVLEMCETDCKDCGELCGEKVVCRSWIYKGVEYSEPPKEMLVEAILRNIGGQEKEKIKYKKLYLLPENLNIFFDGIEKKSKLKQK